MIVFTMELTVVKFLTTDLQQRIKGNSIYSANVLHLLCIY